jgi:hypothetical protein
MILQAVKSQERFFGIKAIIGSNFSFVKWVNQGIIGSNSGPYFEGRLGGFKISFIDFK